MKSLFEEDSSEHPKADADLTLGIGSLLSIFFGVVLICGIFFGFGYSMGRRNARPVATSAVTQPSPAATPAAPAPATQSDTGGVTPKPQQPDSVSSAFPPDFNPPAPDESKSHSAQPSPAQSSRDTHRAPGETGEAARPPKSQRVIASDTASDTPSTSLTPAPTGHGAASSTKPRAGVMAPPAAPPATDEASVPGHIMVQIAAVSRQEDAETLAGALRKRGFSPQVRGGAADKLFHVQVGPFADKAAAETMKQHLLADGYNAIVK